MNKPKTYTVDNVNNAAYIGLEISFKTKKHVNYLLEDISKILLSQTLLSLDVNSVAVYSPILAIEYKSSISKYILKIPKGGYVSLKTRITQLISYLNNNCEIDISSYMKVFLSFNDKELKTIYKIQKMDLFRFFIGIDEEYINKFLPQPYLSPNNMSVKNIIPYKGIVINQGVIFNKNLFCIPNQKYYNIDVSNYHYGEIGFNYIGGENWTSLSENIMKIIEYYVLFTYKQINTSIYTKEETQSLVELKQRFTKVREYLSSSSSYKECKDFPIEIYVNLSNNKQIIQSMWGRIYNNLFNLMFSNNIIKGEFNYDSELDRFQLKSTEMNGGMLIDYDIISSDISNCVLVNCRLYNCTIKNSRIVNSVGYEECDIENCFLNDCDLEQGCVIRKSVYVNKNESVFNGDSEDSLIKYSDISNTSNIDKKTIILNKYSNEAMYRDDNTLEDMSYFNSII